MLLFPHLAKLLHSVLPLLYKGHRPLPAPCHNAMCNTRRNHAGYKIRQYPLSSVRSFRQHSAEAVQGLQAYQWYLQSHPWFPGIHFDPYHVQLHLPESGPESSGCWYSPHTCSCGLRYRYTSQVQVLTNHRFRSQIRPLYSLHPSGFVSALSPDSSHM